MEKATTEVVETARELALYVECEDTTALLELPDITFREEELCLRKEQRQ